MYREYQDALIAKIKNNINSNVQPYAGELERLNAGEFVKSSLPIIYIDFVEDDTSQYKTVDLYFSFYIVHMSFSNNKDTQMNTKNELFDLLQNLYKSLFHELIRESDPIRLLRLKKIFDANISGGYLTVYQKDIKMTIPNPILTGEI